ncbi:MAG: hypothetical protein R2728_00665 [Chitinophagales bacterium]
MENKQDYPWKLSLNELSCLTTNYNGVVCGFTAQINSFDGESIEKVIAIGIVGVKFIADVVAHYLPGLALVNDMETEEVIDGENSENL